MKAAIYNPYLDTLGGGERYTMGVARALVAKNYRVDVEWKDTSIKEKLEKRFGIDLSNVNFIENINRGDGYDVCFWVSDGSIPILRARKNLLHFQFPFKDVNGKTLLNKMKFFRINKIICNSYFTKRFIDKEYGAESIVIYPPVDVKEFRPRRKEDLIFSVGRFSQLEQAKRQDVLIKAFKKFFDSGYSDWKLVLAGGTEVGVDDYVKKLRKLAKDYPIRILESPSFSQIKELYGKAKVFWMASGYGIEEKKNPKKVEHFGITTVEAMAAGAVPIIFAAGGHKEIIADGENGFLWKDTNSLLKSTKRVIEEKGLVKKLSTKAKIDSRVYEYERFEKEIWDIL
ncbi:glycosyltransferase family 4 protein [Candidatus Woesebacteria bacterium]|nr:glycosyltransferase family 4 protein [Candidatus Woesebacteria bacterium]